MGNDTPLLRKSLKHMVKELDIAGYLYEEACFLLDNFNYYKLKNIDDNKEIFCEYLYGLDDQNTQAIKIMLQQTR